MANDSSSQMNQGLYGNLINGGLASNDPMSLASSDNPGAQLVSTQFDGSNFLGWCRGVKMALGAKNKLGFIDGSVVRPPISSDEFQRWLRTDYMVRCWIINSTIGKVGEGFMYVDS